MKEATDYLVKKIAERLNVSERKARKLLADALSSNLIVQEIIRQAVFLNDPESINNDDSED